MASKWLLASSAALPTNNGLIGTRGHHFAPFAGIDTLISPSHFYTVGKPLWGKNLRKVAFHFYTKSQRKTNCLIAKGFQCTTETEFGICSWMHFKFCYHLLWWDEKDTSNLLVSVSTRRFMSILSIEHWPKTINIGCSMIWKLQYNLKNLWHPLWGPSEVWVISGAFVNLHLPSLPFPPFT